MTPNHLREDRTIPSGAKDLWVWLHRLGPRNRVPLAEVATRMDLAETTAYRYLLRLREAGWIDFTRERDGSGDNEITFTTHSSPRTP